MKYSSRTKIREKKVFGVSRGQEIIHTNKQAATQWHNLGHAVESNVIAYVNETVNECATRALLDSGWFFCFGFGSHSRQYNHQQQLHQQSVRGPSPSPARIFHKTMFVVSVRETEVFNRTHLTDEKYDPLFWYEKWRMLFHHAFDLIQYGLGSRVLPQVRCLRSRAETGSHCCRSRRQKTGRMRTNIVATAATQQTKSLWIFPNSNEVCSSSYELRVRARNVNTQQQSNSPQHDPAKPSTHFLFYFHIHFYFSRHLIEFGAARCLAAAAWATKFTPHRVRLLLLISEFCSFSLFVVITYVVVICYCRVHVVGRVSVWVDVAQRITSSAVYFQAAPFPGLVAPCLKSGCCGAQK